MIPEEMGHQYTKPDIASKLIYEFLMYRVLVLLV